MPIQKVKSPQQAESKVLVQRLGLFWRPTYGF